VDIFTTPIQKMEASFLWLSRASDTDLKSLRINHGQAWECLHLVSLRCRLPGIGYYRLFWWKEAKIDG
jgi:hypothetical protein